MHRGRIAAAGLTVTALAGAAWLGAALAADPPPVAPATDLPLADAVAAGSYRRIDGPRGPIHVWIPASYRPDTGATILYVHGYWDTADTAWTKHQLAAQFARSALNAMFIVPEAPSNQRQPVAYPDLSEVLRLVEQHTGVLRGQALTVAMGHSGAYRTLERWLDEPLLDQLVLIDALYGEEDVIVAWAQASPYRRLILIGQDTVLGTEAVADRLPDAYVLDRFPPAYDLWPADARHARVVNIRAQYGHMPLVTEGIVIPSVLRLLPVERLADLPWRAPLAPLPPPSDAGVSVRR